MADVSPLVGMTTSNNSGSKVDAKGLHGSADKPVKVDMQEVAVSQVEADGNKLPDESTTQESKEPKEVNQAVERLNDYIQTVDRKIQFRVDEESGEPIVTVMDAGSDVVIRQIPDDVVIRLAKNLEQDEPVQLFQISV
jgi:flagellar protein FlaG